MKKTNYQFHFIISETIKSHIDYLKKELQFKKDIELYELMLEIISKNLPRLKEIIGDHQSEYALIDSIDDTRVHKYARLKDTNYKKLKKWHSDFNEFGMAGIMRDIILFFYNGVSRYGMGKFIELISRKLKIGNIIVGTRDKMAQLLSTVAKKLFLLQNIIDNLIEYT